jgi:hypothetical protein
MKRGLCWVLAIAAMIAAGGCGCGDRVAFRDLQIRQHRGPATWDAYELEVDPSLIAERRDAKDGCGNPVTELRLTTDKPVKILIVPAKSE